MGMEQIDQYAPVLMLAVVAVGMIAAMMVLSVVLGKRGKRPPIKDTAYECGMLPIGEGTPRFSVKFYIVAMLFILFDIEVVFLYPWAVTFDQLGLFGLVEMAIFIATVFVAYAYVWRRGGLEWD